MRYLIIALLCLSLVGEVNLAYGWWNKETNHWKIMEVEAQKKAALKLQRKTDECDVCGQSGMSNKMYRCNKYLVSYYEGEFVRVHVDCMTTDYSVIEAPLGESKWDFSKWMENKARMERPEIARLFPFLEILDELIDWTASVTFYKVKNTKNGKIYELYKYMGEWKARQKQGKKYLFFQP